MTTPVRSLDALDASNLIALESLAPRAVANGWPAENVLALTEEIAGPLPAPSEPTVHNEEVGGASEALHRLFAEAARRRQEE